MSNEPAMPADAANLMTISDLERRFNEDRDVLNYAIRKAKVSPVGRVGLIRLFHPSDVERVRGALKQIKRDPRSRHAREAAAAASTTD